MEKISKELNSWFFLKINFAEHLKVAYIGYIIWSIVLRMELESSKHIPEIFLTGRAKTPV